VAVPVVPVVPAVPVVPVELTASGLEADAEEEPSLGVAWRCQYVQSTLGKLQCLNKLCFSWTELFRFACVP
jgi:hypothetical protein